MPKIDIASLPIDSRTNYPEPFNRVVIGRSRKRLGIAAGLDQFGVNLTTLKPGAASSLRHWHEKEDELVYLLEGEVVLIEENGETVLKPGDAAGFKANVPNGHHLVNKPERDAVYLAIGSRFKLERSNIPTWICGSFATMRAPATHTSTENLIPSDLLPSAGQDQNQRDDGDAYDVPKFHHRHRRRRHRARHLEYARALDERH